MKDFEKIRADASKGVLFTKFAYQYSPQEQEVIKKLASDIAPDHELLLFSDYLGDTKEFEYRCAVFIDNTHKEIVFANAGTRVGFNNRLLYDLRDDINLLMQMQPVKLQSASKLNSIILDNLGSDVKNYRFLYTGHSLGAIIADVQAADMHFQMTERKHKINSISTVTFDNPGAKKIVDQMFQDKGLDPNSTSVDHVSINNRKNVFNSVGRQVGQTFQIHPDWQNSLGLIEQGVAFIAQVIIKIIKSVARIVINTIEWMSYGSPQTQLRDHKIGNFEKVIINREGEVESLNQILERRKLDTTQYDKNIFKNLKKIKSKNGDIGRPQKYIMKNPKDHSEIVFSQIELKKAASMGVRITQTVAEKLSSTGSRSRAL